MINSDVVIITTLSDNYHATCKIKCRASYTTHIWNFCNSTSLFTYYSV